MRTGNMWKVLQAALVLMLVVAVAPARADWVTTFSEDFEGGTDGQSLTNAPFNWTGNFDIPVYANGVYQKLDPDGLAIGRGGTWLDWITCTKAIPAASNRAVTVVSFDAYAYLRAVDNVCAHWGYFGIADDGDTSGFVHWLSSDAAETTDDDGWYFDVDYVTGSSADNEFIAGHLGTNVHLTINIDRVNDKVWGTLTDGATTVTTAQHTIIKNGYLDTLKTVRFIANADGKPAYGLSIDNILVVSDYAYTPTGPGVIYEEDFEDKENPQAVTNAIFGFVNTEGMTLQVSDTTHFSSDALNGNSGWGYNTHSKIMPEATSNSLLYLFSFDFYADTDDDGVGYPTLYNSVSFNADGLPGVYIYFQGGGETGVTDSINFNASGLTGNSADNMNFYGFRETNATAKFYVDRRNDTCWASITDGTITSNSPVYNMTQNKELNTINFRLNSKSAWKGLDIDNLMFEYIIFPKGTTITLK